MPGPLHHTGPFNMSHYALMNGCTVVLMRRFDSAEVLHLIEKHRITFMFVVPTMMRRIWMLDPAVREASDVSSLQMLSHAAAPCPVWLKERFIEWFGAEKIAESYGGAEEYGATLISGPEWLERRGSVGRAVPGYEAFILDEDGNPLPKGEIGMLWFSGPRGRNTFGDMASIDKDGYVYLADRRTDLIISGGVNIYPAEVEAAIEQHDSVVSAAVVGMPDDDLGKTVHAIVQLADNAPELDSQELEDFVVPLITRSKIPRSWEFTRQMLRDEAGKVRRGALLAARLAARDTQRR
jgi:bile acid-coenzyme A ligase